MAILSSIAPVVVMGLASVLTLSFTPNDVIESDTTTTNVALERSVKGVDIAAYGVLDNIDVSSDDVDVNALPSVDLPVVQVKVVNEEIEKINKITVEAPVVGQIGVQGFKTVALGEYKVKAFCGGKCCNQGGDAKGMKNYKGVNIAVDPNVIPFGTMVLIDGVGIRQAQPSNQNVVGQEIRVYVPNHAEVVNFGEKVLKVVKVV